MTINIPNRRIRGILKQLFEAGLQAADPQQAIKRAVTIKRGTLWVGKRRYNLRAYNRIVVIGAGKASGNMAQAVQQMLGNRVSDGLVVVKGEDGFRTGRINIRKAGHPLPDQRGERAAKKILQLIKPLTPRDLLLVLLSGGASSLLPAPAKGISLAEKQKTTDLLLRCGAAIQDVNTVRKHLSAIKGGRLAGATQATIVSLILSDVLGDELTAIGSGPTAPDPTTFKNARDILQSYRLWQTLPPRVKKHLDQGCKGAIAETPKPGSPIFAGVQNEIIGNNAGAVAKAAEKAKTLGFQVLVLTTTLQGEAQDAGQILGAIAQEIHRAGKPIPRPACVILGGELTVNVKGKGKGGRAQEFALSAALAIAGLPKVCVAALGTDGTDGPTDVAGAVVDGQTALRAKRRGVDGPQYLANKDSYRFFQKTGGHIITGSTGTNVNDLYMILAP